MTINYYLNEKLFAAVQTLATGEGDARNRLALAFKFHLIHINHEQIPQPFSKIWNELRALFDKSSPELVGGKIYTGSVDVATRVIKNKTAAKYNKCIFDMWAATCLPDIGRHELP